LGTLIDSYSGLNMKDLLIDEVIRWIIQRRILSNRISDDWTERLKGIKSE